MKVPGKIVAIDYGERRIGLAVTDGLQLIASPLLTLSNETCIPFLEKYNQEEPLAALVIGLPLGLKGQLTRSTRSVKKFIQLLKHSFPVTPLYAYDERLTSIIAEKKKRELPISSKKKKDKGLLDTLSASVILASFLAHKSRELFRIS